MDRAAPAIPKLSTAGRAFAFQAHGHPGVRSFRYVSRIPRRNVQPDRGHNDAQQKWNAPAPDKERVFRRMEKRDALIDRRDVKFVGNGMARIIGFVFALGHHDLLMMHVLVGDLLEQMMDAV